MACRTTPRKDDYVEVLCPGFSLIYERKLNISWRNGQNNNVKISVHIMDEDVGCLEDAAEHSNKMLQGRDTIVSQRHMAVQFEAVIVEVWKKQLAGGDAS